MEKLKMIEDYIDIFMVLLLVKRSFGEWHFMHVGFGVVVTL